jgi:hypothetical protein
MYVKIILLTAIISLSNLLYAQSTNASKPGKNKKSTTKSSSLNVLPPTVQTSAIETKKQSDEAAPLEQPALTTSQAIIKYMKEKFTASYHGEYYVARRLPFFQDATTKEEKRIQDVNMLHSPAVVYRPTSNWQALATAEFKYSDRDNYIFYPNKFYRSLFTLTRKNILTEKEDGFQLDAGIGRRQFNAGLAIASYGNNRIFTTLAKAFNTTKTSLFVQYLHNDYKHPTSTTWKHATEIYPTVTFQLTDKLTWLISDDIVINLPNADDTERDFYATHEVNIGYINYQWNDKIGIYYQLKYLHARYDFTRDYQSDLDSFENYVGMSYSFTPKISLAGEIGGEIARSSDQEKFLSKKIKYPELAFYLDISL